MVKPAFSSEIFFFLFWTGEGANLVIFAIWTLLLFLYRSKCIRPSSLSRQTTFYSSKSIYVFPLNCRWIIGFGPGFYWYSERAELGDHCQRDHFQSFVLAADSRGRETVRGHHTSGITWTSRNGRLNERNFKIPSPVWRKSFPFF